MKQKKIFWSGIIGNVLDHYDVALYMFLAPFLAPIFFENQDPIVQVILAYGLMSTNLITRPLGSLFFGKMAIKHGAHRTLIITLAGVTLSTFIIGCLPSYRSIGPASPILLVLVRMTQGFFAAGELSIASLFLIEQSEIQKRSKASSYYLCSTMGGIMLASSVAALVSASDNILYYWRYAFLSSALTGIVGLWLRSLLDDIPQEKVEQKYNTSIGIVTENKWKILQIIIISSFSYMTYIVPFVFLNKFVAALQPISDIAILTHNSALLVLDIILLPIFGIIAQKFTLHKWMSAMSGLLMVVIIPIFYSLQNASVIEISILKLVIIIIGVAFVAPMNAWIFDKLQGKEKYLIMGLGYSIGTELLGRNTTVICWALWYHFNNVFAPAMYIVILSLITTIMLLSNKIIRQT